MWLSALRFCYNISIQLYGMALRLASPFHAKAQKWISGRKGWEQSLISQIGDTPHSWIWFHCASLGEFEQGRNLIEALKQKYPDHKILLSFFSPSGYEIRKSYSQADYVCYLPLDSPGNARKFVRIVQPKLVLFIKYELWLNYLREMAEKRIPFLLVAARTPPNSPFFTSIFRGLYRQAFQSMNHIFTQDEDSASLLRAFSGNPEISVSSDTRYDRVASNREEFQPIPAIEQFKGSKVCLIGGSTWPKGESLLLEAFRNLRDTHDLCVILAPHEIHPERISRWEAEFPNESIRFSQIDQLTSSHRILWIDNVGMLSRLYFYGDVAYVGGGWGTGLHNILEATVFGCPVLIGPKHNKFPEAAELIQAGGGFSIGDQEAMNSKIKDLLSTPQLMKDIQRINKAFIRQKAGATDKILSWIETAQILN